MNFKPYAARTMAQADACFPICIWNMFTIRITILQERRKRTLAPFLKDA
jgi:hypothetical protein